MKTSQKSAYILTCSTWSQDFAVVFSIERLHGALSAPSSLLRSAPLLKLIFSRSFFSSDYRKNPSLCIMTHSFCILLQNDLKIRIKWKDTLEHVFTAINVHLSGHNTIQTPLLWLHAHHKPSSYITSVWWYIPIGIETLQQVFFQSRSSSINQLFLGWGLYAKSLGHDFLYVEWGHFAPT